jgi:hypothetical protein
MTLIKKPAELSTPQTIKAMIYGQAGVGKTTLALSAPKPLLLDFDGGIHRVNFEHQCDTLPVASWDEALQVLQEDLSAYQSIVVDTIGKMMDFIIESAEQKNINGWKKWDYINDQFKAFIRKLGFLGKNAIFVAHRDTRKEGEETVFVPALREKNYTAIVTELDLLGYVEMRGTNRTITFNPTNRNDGKNTCNLPAAIILPVCVDKDGKALRNNFFVDSVINPYVANLQKRIDSYKEYDALMAELKNNISCISDEVSANDFCSRINEFTHIGNSKSMVAMLLRNRCTELGLKFNNQTKKYEKAS